MVDVERVPLAVGEPIVLSGGLIELRAESRKLTAPGQYQLEIEIDCGGDSPVVFRKDVAC